MKNGALVTAYLDECAALTALQEADFEAWFACIADGWTVAELDAAYERRFGRKVRRG